MCQVCGYVVFRNPAPVAVVVATLADKILLVQRAKQPLEGYWAPPAGYVEILDLGLFARDELPRQSPPLEGTELDRWFFEIVSGLLAKF